MSRRHSKRDKIGAQWKPYSTFVILKISPGLIQTETQARKLDYSTYKLNWLRERDQWENSFECTSIRNYLSNSPAKFVKQVTHFNYLRKRSIFFRFLQAINWYKEFSNHSRIELTNWQTTVSRRWKIVKDKKKIFIVVSHGWNEERKIFAFDEVWEISITWVFKIEWVTAVARFPWLADCEDISSTIFLRLLVVGEIYEGNEYLVWAPLKDQSSLRFNSIESID